MIFFFFCNDIKFLIVMLNHELTVKIQNIITFFVQKESFKSIFFLKYEFYRYHILSNQVKTWRIMNEMIGKI